MKKIFVLLFLVSCALITVTAYGESELDWSSDHFLVKLTENAVTRDSALGIVPILDVKIFWNETGIQSWKNVFPKGKSFANGLERWFRLYPQSGTNMQSLIETYQRQPFIQYAHLSYLLYPDEVPNDPDYPDQWHLEKVMAAQAWDIGHCSSDVVIAILDSGFDMNHEDLQDSFWENGLETPGNGIDDDGNGYIDDVNGYDFWGSDNNPDNVDVANLHGSHVAGIAGATTNNGIGIAGGTWGCSLMLCKVFPDRADGGANPGDVAEGIIYAADNGADVINLSLGNAYDIPIEREAIEYAVAVGTVICAAAGNGGDDGMGDFEPHYPASYPGVIGVGNTTRFDVRNDSSNYGEEWVDVYAPGTSLRSTIPENTYKGESGTSMASPLAAALAALLISNNPGITPDEVLHRMQQGCENIDAFNPAFHGELDPGRINFYYSLAETPLIRTDHFIIMDQQGNGNFEGDAGETVNLHLYLKNVSWMDGMDIAISMDVLEGSGVSIIDGNSTYGDMASHEMKMNLDPLTISIETNEHRQVAITVFVTGSGGYQESFELQLSVNNPIPQMPGFPAFSMKGYNSSPKTGDLNGDGNLEIVCADNDGLIHVFRHDGTELPGWPVFTGSHQAFDDVLVLNAPAIADLDLNGDLEVIIADRFHDKEYYNNPALGTKEKSIGRIIALHHNGQYVDGFPVLIDTEFVDSQSTDIPDIGFKCSPSIADVVGDTHPEIIAGNYGNDVYVISYTGDILPGWPLDVKTDVFATAACSDINLDGRMEIVIATKADTEPFNWGEIYVFNGEGETLAGFPVRIPNQVYSSPILVDLDSDAVPEIVFGYGDYGMIEPGHGIQALNINGGKVPGFPVETDASVYGSPAAGDLNEDGIPEIVVSTLSGKVYAVDHTGAMLPQWPVQLSESGINSSPAIADINNADGPEVVVGCSDGYLYILHADGTYMEGTPLALNNDGFASPCIADIDRDGDIEIIMNNLETFVFNFSGTFDNEQQYWPSFHRDNANNGRYGHPGHLKSGVNMLISRDFFTAETPFKLDSVMVNGTDQTVNDLELFVILDIWSQYYFFYPSWQQTATWGDIPTLEPGAAISTVFDFAWPAGDLGSASGLAFWGALLDSQMALFGDYSYITFGY